MRQYINKKKNPWLLPASVKSITEDKIKDISPNFDVE